MGLSWQEFEPTSVGLLAERAKSKGLHKGTFGPALDDPNPSTLVS
jgi:hypothetical protein